MAVEIERKFLVTDVSWIDKSINSKKYIQGYLVGGASSSVRVRLEGNHAFINIKSATLNVTRHEYEYEIPLDDAREILDRLCEKPHPRPPPTEKPAKPHRNRLSRLFSGENFPSLPDRLTVSEGQDQ